jgi:hypothetical protein
MKWAKDQKYSKEVQMRNKYTKKCSTSLAVKEMQLKMTLRFHLTPVRMTIIENIATDAGKDVCVCWGNNIYTLLEGM